MKSIAYFIGKRGVTAALSVVFALMPFAASAVTVPTTDVAALIAQLQAQIASLQAQIQALQVGPPSDFPPPQPPFPPPPEPPLPPGPVVCPNLPRSLYLGSRGDDVSGLQQFLREQGFFQYSTNTGYFGPATEQAVRYFQEKRDIVSSGDPETTGFGVVGKQTREAIANVCGGVPPEPPPIPPISQNLPPVISGVSGPTSLQVGEQGMWTVNAYDPESGTLSYRVIWGDETPSVSGGGGMTLSVPFPAQTATFTHSYAAGGSYTPIFYVTDNTGQQAKTSISVNVGNISNEWMKEQVKCVFNGSNTEQRCYTSGLEGVLECSGVNSCVVDNVPGWRGEQITWKSSCGGYAYTTIDGIDGINEHATFQCGTSTQPSITVTSPNGGETQRGSNYSITWTRPIENIPLPADTTFDISLIPYQEPCPAGKACILGFPAPLTIVKNYYDARDGVYSWIVGNVQEANRIVNDGSYYIQICTSSTSICDQSDSYFKIVTSTTQPSMSVVLDANSPAFRDIVEGSSNVELARIKFSANGEDINLKRVALQLSDAQYNTPFDLADMAVTLWDGTTQVGEAIFAFGDDPRGDNAGGNVSNFRIPNGGSKVLTIKGTIATISAGGLIKEAGDILKVDFDGDNRGIDWTHGIGVNSGSVILPTNSPDTHSAGVRIVATSIAQPSITISGPSGKEIWYQGGVYEVRWKAVDMPSDGKMLIRLRSMESQKEYYLTTTSVIGSDVRDDRISYGREKVTIPASLPTGAYALEIKTSIGNQSYSDASDSFRITTLPTKPPITVISPNGGEQWVVGSTQTIRWSGGWSDRLVNVLLLDSAKNPVMNIASGLMKSGSGGSEAWTIPATIASGKYYVRVASFSSFAPLNIMDWLDDSDAPFSIVAPTTGLSVDLKVNGLDQPTAVLYNSQFNVSWSSSGAKYCNAYGNHIPRADGGTWNDLMNLPTAGARTLIARHGTQGFITPLQVSIQCFDGAAFKVDTIYVPVTQQTSQPSITVLSPNGGEQWRVGEMHTIQWTSQGNTATGYNIQIGLIDTRYSTEVGPRGETTIAYSIPNSGSYSWIIPQSVGGMDLQDTSQPVYKVIIHSWSDAVTGVALADQSDAPFSIVTAPTATKSVSLTAAPTSGQAPLAVSFTGTLANFPSCGNTITWTFGDGMSQSTTESCAGTINITASRTITATRTYSAPGTYTARLTVGSIPSNDIAITVTSAPTIQPSVTMTSPNGGENWEVGKTYPITWTTSAFPSSAVVSIALYDTRYPTGDARNAAIVATLTNTGSYNWAVPQSLGQLSGGALGASSVYKMRAIVVDAAFGSKFDESNGLFSIAAPSGGEGEGGGGGEFLLETWNGTWNNENSATDFNTRLAIAVSGTNFVLHPWSSCCDWGERTVAQTSAIANNTLSFDWSESNKTIRYTLTLLSTTRLHAVSKTSYTDGRPGYTRDEYFTKSVTVAPMNQAGLASVYSAMLATLLKIQQILDGMR